MAGTCISRCSTGERIWAGMTQTAGERPRPVVGFVTFVRRNFRSAWSPEMAKADPQRPFVHLDVQTAYSAGGTSPSLPEDYLRARIRQHPLNADALQEQRPYLAVAGYGLRSVVKTAAACARAGIEHIRGLRVRVVRSALF